MKLKVIDPPRTFEVGWGEKRIQLQDCAHLELAPDEQVTLFTESGAEYDVARKSWGFYATPSLNGRLRRFGLHGVLVKNRINQFFVMLVEQGKEADFADYLAAESLEVVTWLNTDELLQQLEQAVEASSK